MPEFAVGDEVAIYTSEEVGLRKGIVVGVPTEDANFPMLTVKIGDTLWIGPSLHLFPPDVTEEAAQQEVDEKLATYGQELAARRAQREAELEAAMATDETGGTEEAEGSSGSE